MDLNNKAEKNCTAGKLYCLYNEMYQFYGDNVYKLGNSKDIESRLNGYTTSYIKPCELKLESVIFRNKDLAETLLFDMLKDHRISNSREFFKCDLSLIKEKMKEVKQLFDKHNDDTDLYQYLEKTKIKIDSIFNKESILNAKDITNKEFEALLYKQKNNIATEADKLSIEKHCYKLNWGKENINMDFMDFAYRKTHILLNLRLIYNGDDNNKLITIDSNYIKYANMISKEKIRIIKDFLNILGYNSLTEEKLIIKEDFQTNMTECIEKAELFTNTKYTMPLFGMTKKTTNNIRSFLGFINSILDNYGLTISNVQKNKRINKKHTSINYYKLHTISDFLKYLKIKNPFLENLVVLLQN